MNLIKIVPPAPTGEAQTGMGTQVFDAAGKPVDGVKAIKVILGVDELLTAEISVLCEMAEVWAEPWMSEEAFLMAADRYGYIVTKRDAGT